MTSSSQASPHSGTTPYIGRFAPSPSGPLHFGSLITALASFLDARHHHGQWLVRMEDIDPPREEAGAKQWILNSLAAHGLEWDGPVRYQSQRLAVYDEVMAQLQAQAATYLCTCSRQRLLELRGTYDSHCLNRTTPIPEAAMTSTRLNLGLLSDDELAIAEHYGDIFQGPQSQSLRREVGDFIIRRKDGLVAYQLAVVVDDIDQHITHIIRGSDLLSSTPRQRYLTQLLNGPQATYGHIPVATNREGQKLSKQHKAPGINDDTAFQNLCEALIFLHHPAPGNVLESQDIQQLLAWAIAHWSRKKLPQTLSCVVTDD